MSDIVPQPADPIPAFVVGSPTDLREQMTKAVKLFQSRLRRRERNLELRQGTLSLEAGEAVSSNLRLICASCVEALQSAAFMLAPKGNGHCPGTNRTRPGLHAHRVLFAGHSATLEWSRAD